MNWLERWFERWLTPEAVARSHEWEDATNRWRLDNAFKRNRGCYACGGTITKEVQHHGNIGDEPVRWYACDDHYLTLYRSIYGKRQKS